MATSRIFYIPAGDTVHISGIKMQGGNGEGTTFPGSGGAIHNQGILTLTKTAVNGNSATSGGGIFNTSSGILTLTKTAVNGNSATSSGGGIWNQGIITLTNCTLSGNSNKIGSGIDFSFGGGVFNTGSGSMTLTNCTLSGNFSQFGGGVYNSGGSMTLTNCTLSGNSASIWGGGVNNGDEGTMTLTNSTVSGNTASSNGGGVKNFSAFTLTNSIVAKNTGASNNPDIDASFGSIIDGGHNLIGDGTGQSSLMNANNGNQVGTAMDSIDPLFIMDVPANDSLGGDLRLQCGSPAIDAGKPDTTGLNLGLVDLGGLSRVETKRVDIGAYEFQVTEAPAPITEVTNTNDAGCGSLRFAICNAMPGDTITFAAPINGQAIKLITEIVIDTNLVIIGNDTTNTIIDGMATSRIFYIPSGDTVSISGIKMQGGNGVGVVLTNTGGAILNQGILTLTNSTVSGNSANSSAGGINNNSGLVTLTNSTVSGNSAVGFGGGIFNNTGALTTLTNSTVSGNSAEFGSGIHNFGSVMLTNTTVSGNSANIGGGIANESGSLTLTNSIIAKNTANGTGPDIYNSSGTIMDGGNNLIGDGSGQSTLMNANNGNQVGTAMNSIDPLFIIDVPANDSLGGDLRLQCGSPAIDAGRPDTSGLALGQVDLGGIPRIAGKRIDIGAHEAAASCHEIDLLDISSASISDSSTFDFAEVCGMTTETLYIKNIGDHQIFIDSITLASIGTNPGSYTYNAADFTKPDTIACGDSLLLSITFDPQEAGADSAILRIYNNDSDEAIYDLVLTGSGDETGPVIMCSDTTIYLDAMGDATIDTSFFDLTFSDNCTISTLTLSKAVFTCIDVGTPMVTITATDGYGNSATCTATVTVRDTISPVVMCMDKTIYLSAAGTATIDSSYIMASATDACGIMSVVPSQTSFSCTDIGTNTVALTAHDKNGNSSMCTATVTVRDTISPVVTCMDTTIYLDVNGMAVIDSSFVVSSAIDACSSVTLSLGQTSFTCGDLGTQEVTISATDANDNTSTCTANVTILKTPLMTTQIAGPSTICPGLSQIAYSASTITGATAYQWSYAGTGVSINNNGSNQITLDFASDATAGILTVDVIDACGDVSSSATHAIQIESGAICTLVDCARDGIYIDDELLALIGSLDVYRASQSIESDATILSDRNLVFKAGQAITFYPGFNVEQGGVLEAIIEACGE